MSATRSRIPSRMTRSGQYRSTASSSSVRRLEYCSPRTLNTSSMSMGNWSAGIPVRGMIRLRRISCVDSSLCSVSYHSTCRGFCSIRSKESTLLRKHSAIRMLLANVLPLLALPDSPVSSPRAKQGLPCSRKRNSICWSSVSGVILRRSNCISHCSCSALKPAKASSARTWRAASAFID